MYTLDHAHPGILYDVAEPPEDPEEGEREGIAGSIEGRRAYIDEVLHFDSELKSLVTEGHRAILLHHKKILGALANNDLGETFGTIILKLTDLRESEIISHAPHNPSRTSSQKKFLIDSFIVYALVTLEEDFFSDFFRAYVGNFLGCFQRRIIIDMETVEILYLDRERVDAELREFDGDVSHIVTCAEHFNPVRSAPMISEDMHTFVATERQKLVTFLESMMHPSSSGEKTIQ